MRIAILILCLVIGLSKIHVKSDTIYHNVMHKKYNVYLPSEFSIEEKLPFVIGLHGLNQSVKEFET